MPLQKRHCRNLLPSIKIKYYSDKNLKAGFLTCHAPGFIITCPESLALALKPYCCMAQLQSPNGQKPSIMQDYAPCNKLSNFAILGIIIQLFMPQQQQDYPAI